MLSIWEDDKSIFERKNAPYLCKRMNSRDAALRLGKADWTVESVCSRGVAHMRKLNMHSVVDPRGYVREFCFGAMVRPS